MIFTGRSHGNDAISFNFFNALSIFLVSASVIALQIIFMRSLSITRYHHFSYLVISTALLGFGASGTFLTFFSHYLKERFRTWLPLFIGLFAITIPICSVLTEQLPIDIQYLVFSKKQVFYLTIYNLLLFIPFFLSGVVIGLALIHFKEKVPLVYGANLLGSGAGGIMGIILMYYFPAVVLPTGISLIVVFALMVWFLSFRPYFDSKHLFKTAPLLILAVIVPLFFLSSRPKINIDQYKTIAHLERLREQSQAERLLTRFSPRARIDVYDSKALHQTLFAGLSSEALPPPQLGLLIDGQLTGTIFKVSSKDEVSILDSTPQSLPYRLIESPSVLLLGETGGAHVWLAQRFGASTITVVQGNEQINGILLNELAEASGNVYRTANVEVITKAPHLFISQTKERFDIIHIVSAEGVSAGVSGLQSLHEDYLLTVESIARCYEKLTERGIITLTRGIQIPPRDNLKIFSLFASALEYRRIEKKENHLLQARNYLAVNTMIAKQPLDGAVVNKLRTFSQDLLMDTEYYPGIKSNDIEQRNWVEGPEGKKYSYFHHGALQILSQERADFFNEWVYKVDPPTDDRPYFYDFFKWTSLGRFVESYGNDWLRRLELGSVVLVVTFLETTLAAVVLILIPLLWLRTRTRGEGGKLPTALYFLSLGFGFMFIEMVFIQKFTKFMGDPIYAVTVALTAVLVFAGLGSLYQKRIEMPLVKRIRYAVLGISLVAISYLFFLESVLNEFIGYGIAVRFLVTTLSLAPLSFFMGWMFPSGLMILEKGSKNLIPWAWGINGFASVSAAPLSVMLSISYGFSGVIVIAVVLYLTAGVTGGWLGKSIR